MKKTSLLTKISAVYILFICAWLVTRLMLGDRFWWLSFANTLAEYFFVPLPFLMLASLYQRRRAGLWLLLPLIIFVAWWGALYLPNRLPDEAQEVPQLRAMSFNVKASNEAPELLANTISAEMPDVIGFQELSSHNIPALEAGLQADYPYHTFDLYDGRISDVGFASRFPILSAERMNFPPRDTAVHAVIDWNGQVVQVFVLHFSADNLYQFGIREFPGLEQKNLEYRVLEVTRMQEEIANLQDPILVLCDCNFTETTQTYTRMAEMFQDSFLAQGWGPGHTLLPDGFPFPVLRIDYIWHSQEFTAVSSHVGDPQSSDHHPLISVLALTGGSD